MGSCEYSLRAHFSLSEAAKLEKCEQCSHSESKYIASSGDKFDDIKSNEWRIIILEVRTLFAALTEFCGFANVAGDTWRVEWGVVSVVTDHTF